MGADNAALQCRAASASKLIKRKDVYVQCSPGAAPELDDLCTKTTAALKKGTVAEGLVRLMNGQDVNIRFSLKGLKPALDELQSTVSR